MYRHFRHLSIPENIKRIDIKNDYIYKEGLICMNTWKYNQFLKFPFFYLLTVWRTFKDPNML